MTVHSPLLPFSDSSNPSLFDDGVLDFLSGNKTAGAEPVPDTVFSSVDLAAHPVSRGGVSEEANVYAMFVAGSFPMTLRLYIYMCYIALLVS